MYSETYVPIPKDMSKVKNKLAFGLTKRQLIGFAAAGIIGIPSFFFFNRVFSQEIGMAVMFVLGAPCLLFALFERDGMPSEEWLTGWLRHKYLRQKVRRYKKPSMKQEDIQRRVAATRRKKAIEIREARKMREESGAYFRLSIEKNSAPLVRALHDLVVLAINKLRKEEIPEVSTQDTILYEEMHEDGLCRIDNNTYSKTIEYEDINYQLAHDAVKDTIFSEYCAFLNSFEETIRIQFTFINVILNSNNSKSIVIELQYDGYDDIRMEYQKMLQLQLEKGNNGLIRRKYITFSITARNILEARQRLSRIESDSIVFLQSMKVPVLSFPINGKRRLEIFHSFLNDKSSFRFGWNKCQKLGLRTQDYIAPISMDFSDKRYCRSGSKYIKTQHLMIQASELSDRTLAKFLEMDAELIVNIHLQPIAKEKAIKAMKGKISDIGKMIIAEQGRALRQGYDIELLPPDLVTYSDESKKILKALESQNEKWFMATVLVTNISTRKAVLENDSLQARSIAQACNCDLKPYDYNQENCLLSAMPFGVNYTYPRRGLTTSSVAAFMPFTTQDLFMGGESLYYGLNAISNNMIMLNRKELDNPNGLILGTTGSGKSFAAKREIANGFLFLKDHIIICDPEGEYTDLVMRLGGQVIIVSLTSGNYVNPLDVNLDYSDDVDPLQIKADFILSMMDLICGGKNGLTAGEISLIDRCSNLIYRKYVENPRPENMPILEDLYNVLKNQDSSEAKNLAEALEIYVHGSLKVFNNRTNVDIRNRLVCFNIKDLGKSTRKIGMLTIQDHVWNTVARNALKQIYTWYYIDEFHLLLKDEQTASYCIDIWKRFRKRFGIPTGITQNVKDLLRSMEVENIFENTDFVYLLKQSSGDRAILASRLALSDLQLSHVDNSPQGCGLLKYGGLVLPFKDKFPEDMSLYRLMTTKANEIARLVS